MNEDENTLIIKLKYFERSYEECDNYISNIMERTKHKNDKFYIHLINDGSDIEKFKNLTNAIKLARLLSKLRLQLIQIKIFKKSKLIETTITLVKSILGYNIEEIVEFID